MLQCVYPLVDSWLLAQASMRRLLAHVCSNSSSPEFWTYPGTTLGSAAMSF